ncbi:pentatricopeptide repeat-containing protein At2g02750 [Impatiens glandulifera]|uniref:pentatricopeptide repeat-containing protein At2g02750 n=1 Tax=Impatiens glandulifera TaxID=253017 RepID=UPI001FB0FC00|nr:pentatricopeptide repeat-containing protein At2g02750 [Impatiens glandulifera]
MKREISNLIGNGLYRDLALSLYSRSHAAASISPDKFAFPSLFKVCGLLQQVSLCHMLHIHLIKTGFHADVYASTALTDAYMKLGCPDDALKVFDEMHERSLASFNAVISGFLKNGDIDGSFKMFKRLLSKQAVRPNSVTIACLLSSSSSPSNGHQVHCWAVKLGVESEIYAATSLVTMYSSRGELGSAAKVFKNIETKNVVCYNAYISGILQNGVPLLALDVFKEMHRCSDESSPPNSVTMISVLSACSVLGCVGFGRQIHGILHKINMGSDTKAGTALIDLYSKCGHWSLAYKVFDELNGNRNLTTWNCMIAGMMLNGQSDHAIELFMKLFSGVEGIEPDLATWNSLICGFSQIGKNKEALFVFRKMLSIGAVPSLKSLTCLLPACSSLSALQLGKEVHGYIIRTYLCFVDDEFISTALVDMYMKCGQFLWAQKTFDQSKKTRSDDPSIWNAMIDGYGRNAETESAFRIFYQMIQENIQPNEATFLIILSMCSHNGLVDRGLKTFLSMNKDHGVIPKSKHLSCVIDLLGRSGYLDEARELFHEISEPAPSVCASLLSVCVDNSNISIGEEMAKELSELEPENPLPFVILSGIYAYHGRWRDAHKTRERLNSRKLKKLPALSFINGVTDIRCLNYQ